MPIPADTAVCILLVLDAVSSNAMDKLRANVCPDENNKSKCCANYRRINGSCTECIGYFGKDCTSPCVQGYYGASCEAACNCNQNQTCNRFVGCLPKETISGTEDYRTLKQTQETVGSTAIVITALGSGICTSLLWCITLFCYKKRKSLADTLRKLVPKKRCPCNFGRSRQQTETKEITEEECTYTYVRESKMVLDECIQKKKSDVMNPNNLDSSRISVPKAMQKLTNGRRCTNSNDYNHLHFDGSRNKVSQIIQNQYNHIEVRSKGKKKADGQDKESLDTYVSLTQAKTTNRCEIGPISSRKQTNKSDTSKERPYSIAKHGGLSQ